MDHASLTLLDWRRRVHAVYTVIRASTDLAQAHAVWSAERDDLFARHPQSPIAIDRRDAFTGVPVAAYDPAWRFELPVETDVEASHIEIATGTDGVVPFDRVGVVRIPTIGQLDVWALRSYGGGLFIPLRDRTANRTTYGGGRYLIDTAKGADLGSDARAGTIVLDFNFAYHPSCAYDAAWACPLAPPGNVLDLDVPVGEQLPAGGWY
jgi:uncharacterized protein (DUF1684 family)